MTWAVSGREQPEVEQLEEGQKEGGGGEHPLVEGTRRWAARSEGVVVRMGAQGKLVWEQTQEEGQRVGSKV